MSNKKNAYLKAEQFFKWSMLALLLSFPFFGYLKHPTLLLTLLVCLTLAVWGWHRTKGKQRLFLDPVDFIVLLLAIAFFFGGAFVKNDWREAFLQGITRALLLLIYFPAVDFFRYSLWRKRGAFVLQISGGIASFLGILQYFQGKAILKWVDLERFSDIGGRVTGGFGNPNVLSVYLLLVLPISLVFLFQEKSPLMSRLFALISLSFELLCLILTWSRGAWLGVIFSVFFFLLLFSRLTRKCLLWGIPLLLSLSFFLPHNIINRFLSIGDLKESSIQYRLWVWKGVGRMLWEHPFGIGLGYENFSARYRPYAVSGTETVIHTHQIFLQIFCELGVIGGLLFLFFLGWLLFRLLKKSSQIEKNHEMQRFGGGGALFGVLIMGMFDDVWYHYGVFCLFWIMVALSSSYARDDFD